MSKNNTLINEYISFRLNPSTEKLVMTKISESRARRIKFNLEKFDRELNGKDFLKLDEKDISKFFSDLKNGELTRPKRLKVEGDISVLKKNVPYSDSALNNFWSDLSNFYTFLVYKYKIENPFLFVKKP